LAKELPINPSSALVISLGISTPVKYAEACSAANANEVTTSPDCNTSLLTTPSERDIAVYQTPF